jgi:hypothetical protein
MEVLVFALATAVVFIAVGITFGIRSSLLSISAKKGKLRLAGLLCVGAGICTAGLAAFAFQASLAVFDVTREISRVQVKSENKGYRTLVAVRTSTGEIDLNASGRSNFFQTGQRMQARYEGVTGHILKARFLSENSTQVGVFNGTDTWAPYGITIGGLFVISVGLLRYRSDPEATHRL